MPKKPFRKNIIITKNHNETQKIGIRLAKLLNRGDLVCLVGEIGSGKTTLVQGIGKGLGIRNNLTSPSFVLAREYPEKHFYHLDLYRLNSRDFLVSGLNQYLVEDNICAIEWAEKIESILPDEYIEIKIFFYTNKSFRKIVLTAYGKKFRKIGDAFLHFSQC